MAEGSFTDRFSAYFDRPVAQTAAKSLADGAEIQFQVSDPAEPRKPIETFTFTKQNKRNQIVPGAARKPQVSFELTPAAAEAILAEPAEDVGAIGVGIAKLVVSQDPAKKVGMKFNTGFLGLFSNGYLGVVAAGGGAFASFLASRGLNGVSGIKEALKKLKG
jgi:hypothetical protein